MTPRQMLTHAFTLEREGKPAPAIAELQALLDSKSLDDSGVGKAWNVLGLAFQDQGNFSASQNAYEHSIRSFEGLPNNISDYAMALDDFGGLYVDTRQFELALELRVKALHLYEKLMTKLALQMLPAILQALSLVEIKSMTARDIWSER